jgi:uncharacterized membrane protein YphA (DoxX/SURF4 family)
MNILLWIIQGALTIMFAMAGYGKISSSKEQHIADGHIKVSGSVLLIRILGVLEWLGCIGLIVPWMTGIAPVLTPIAAACFGMIMIMGLYIHIRRKEFKMLFFLFAILILALLVAYFRFRQLF